MSSAFELTAAQRQVLLNSCVPIPVVMPEAERQYVIIDKDTYERLKALSQVDEADPSFFDCEDQNCRPVTIVL